MRPARSAVAAATLTVLAACSDGGPALPEVAGVAACDAVTAAQLAATLSWDAGPARAIAPDGGPQRVMTGCSYDRVTVWAVGRGAWQRLYLLKGRQYVNVVLEGFPARSAEQLVPVVAAGLP